MDVRLEPLLRVNGGAYQNKEKVANEIAHRLPLPISEMSFISHVPLVYISEEDSIFYHLVDNLSEWFPDMVQQKVIQPALNLWKKQYPYYTDEIGRIVQNQLINAIRHIKDEYPWFIICSSVQQIMVLLIKFTVISEDDYDNLQHYQNALNYVHRLIIEKWDKIEHRIAQEVAEVTPHLTAVHQPRLGGFMSWAQKCEGVTFIDLDDGDSFSDTFGEDHLAIQLPEIATPGATPSTQLRWDRSTQYWTYSLVRQYGHESMPNCEELAAFTADLLRTSWGWSPLKEELFEKNTLPRGITLPGKFISGAHYVFIPCPLLLALVTNPNLFCDDKVGEALKNLRVANVNSKLNHFQQTYLDVLRDRGRALLKRLQTLAWKRTPDAAKFEISLPQWYLFVEELRREIAGNHDCRMQFNEILADSMRHLWNVLYFDEITKRKGREDFIACSVMNDRGLYFSNFRPMDELLFTRTFFVDINLTPFQRGRLVSALCDIATYRLVCVRDIERVRAILSGLDEKNRRFNRMQSYDFSSSQTLSSENLTSLRENLHQLNRLLVSVFFFNRFITNGVSGKSASAVAYLQRIRARGKDIREHRIPGYAVLGDFLERGIAPAVLEIRRMADRFESLRNSIEDSLNGIRTEINAFEAQTATDTIVEQVRLTRAAEILVFSGGTYYVAQFLMYVHLQDGVKRILQISDIASKYDDLIGILSLTAISFVIVVVARLIYLQFSKKRRTS